MGTKMERAFVALASLLEPPTIRHAAMSPRDAELQAAEWMRSMGMTDAEATPVGPDAGVDVRSATACAQVKHWTDRVGRKDVQNIYGVARAENRSPIFFALETEQGHYTRQAIEWGETNGVALFAYTEALDLKPITAAARSLMLQRSVVIARQRIGGAVAAFRATREARESTTPGQDAAARRRPRR